MTLHSDTNGEEYFNSNHRASREYISKIYQRAAMGLYNYKRHLPETAIIQIFFHRPSLYNGLV